MTGSGSRARATLLALGCLGLAACDLPGTAVADRMQVADGDPARGRTLVAAGDYGCTACHTIPGIHAPAGIVGPPLVGMAQRAFIAGQLPNKPDVLVAFLQNPSSLVPETGMPDVRLGLQEARDVAAYLYTLEPPRAP
jgi:cytochrome c2